MSAHLPHANRQDSEEVATQFMHEVFQLLHALRYFDTVTVGVDLNLDLQAPCDGTNRSVTLRALVREGGLLSTSPTEPTWYPPSTSPRNPSRIDYLWCAGGGTSIEAAKVLTGERRILGSDHEPVVASICQAFPTRRAWRKPCRDSGHRCGKWMVDTAGLQAGAETMADQLAQDPAADLDIDRLAKAVQQHSRRPTFRRYVDPPELKDLIRRRKGLTGEARVIASAEIQAERKLHRARWLQETVRKAAEGDAQALLSLRKRQSTQFAHNSYAHRAGGPSQAVRALQVFYKHKYTSEYHRPAQLARAILQAHSQATTQVVPFEVKELRELAATCPSRKSAGHDGITYEAIRALLDSGLADELCDFFNEVLLGTRSLPDSWLCNIVVFLPKIPKPYMPKHLRPIVLSSCMAKLFSKALLYRIRPSFPPLRCGQLCARTGGQILDGALAAQQLGYLAAEYNLPLLFLKLDVEAAFDSLEHAAVARFLCACTPTLEARMLLDYIILSVVTLRLGHQTWQQQLGKGLLQGTPFSAELFGRVLDHFLGDTWHAWSNRFDTWIQARGCHLHAILYADDILLVAASYSELQAKLQDVQRVLAPLGLRLALSKCKLLVSPALPTEEFRVGGHALEKVDTLVFLGVLLGFAVTSCMTLSARTVRATNAFYAFYALLAEPSVALTSRLALLCRHVTSTWRWLSPAVRPVQDVCTHLTKLSTDLLMRMLPLARDGFLGAEDWVARRRAAKVAAQQCGFVSWPRVLWGRYLAYWAHAARLPPDNQPPIRTVLGIRGRVWLLLHGQDIRRLPGNWPDHNRFLQLQWERTRRQGDPLSWQVHAQQRQQWKTWADQLLLQKGILEVGFYPRVTQIDLHGRCLVQHVHGFHLLPARLEPVEPPFPSTFVDIREAPLRRLVNQWIIHVDHLVAAPHSLSLVAILRPPCKPLSKSWVRRIRQEIPSSQAPLQELILGVHMASTILQACPTHVVQVLLGSAKGVLLGLGDKPALDLLPQHAQIMSELARFGHATELRHARTHTGQAVQQLLQRQLQVAAMQPTCLRHVTVRIDGTQEWVGVTPRLT